MKLSKYVLNIRLVINIFCYAPLQQFNIVPSCVGQQCPDNPILVQAALLSQLDESDPGNVSV